MPILKSPAPDPIWLRLPNEPSQAFEAFCVYRDLDLNRRSILAAYRQSKGILDPIAAWPPGNWTNWSRRFRWTERVDAYLRRHDIQQQKDRDKRIRTLVAQPFEAKMAALKAGAARHAKMEVILDAYEEAAKLGLSDRSSSVTEIVNGRKVRKTETFTAVKMGGYVKLLYAQSDLQYQIIESFSKPTIKKKKIGKKTKTKSVELNLDGPALQTTVAGESSEGNPKPPPSSDADFAMALNLVAKSAGKHVES